MKCSSISSQTRYFYLMAAQLSLQPYPLGMCEWGGKQWSAGWKVCSFQEQVLQITLILHVICKVHALGSGGEVLLSAQTSQYVGWIVLILSGASFWVLLLDKHIWEFKSNHAVVFLGGMGPGTRDLCRLGSPNYYYVCVWYWQCPDLFIHYLFTIRRHCWFNA